MKPVQTENTFVLIDVPTFWRRMGVALFFLSTVSFLFAYFGASYFAGENIVTFYTLAIIFSVIGIVFFLLGWMLISMPNRKLEINSTTKEIFLTEKLIRTSFEEFSFADVERVELIEHAYENSTAYLPQIVLRGGRTIKLPSDSEGDERKQAKIFEQVRSLLEK